MMLPTVAQLPYLPRHLKTRYYLDSHSLLIFHFLPRVLYSVVSLSELWLVCVSAGTVVL